MVLVVGSSNVDYVFKVDHFTSEGETQRAESFQLHPGGKGANQAVTVGKLKGESLFLSCLSENDGQVLIKNFMRWNVKGWKVCGEYTGKAFIEVTKEGKNRIIIYPGANSFLTPEVVNQNKKIIENSDIVLLQNEIPLDGNKKAVDIAKRLGKYVILDPAPAQNLDKDILTLVDLITPNEEEAKVIGEFFGCEFENPESFVKCMVKSGVKAVIVKLGENGSIYYDGKNLIKVDAFKVENVVDTTAAGDVYNGALATALDEGKSMEEAMVFASAASAISVTRMGAQSSIPQRKEVAAFLKNQKM